MKEINFKSGVERRGGRRRFKMKEGSDCKSMLKLNFFFVTGEAK